MWMYAVGKALLTLPMHLIYKVTVSGKENIPAKKGRGFILASNHISNADPILLGISVKPQLHFMAKEELFANPFFGWVLRQIGAFSVSRGKGDMETLNKGGELVEAGKTLAIFPEGHRSKDGNLQKAKSGVILIASNSGGDILPVCVTALPKRKHHRKHIHIMFGTMIHNKEVAVENARNLAQIKSASRLLMERIAGLREKTLAMFVRKEG